MKMNHCGKQACRVALFLRSTFVALIPAVSIGASGTELIYTPINPTFGGSPLNGSYFLGKAQSQNDHIAEGNSGSGNTTLSRFEETLQRNVLNQIAREVAGLAFGEGGLAEGGVFHTEQYTIEVITTNPDSVGVRISNSDTGEVTTIEIPIFN